MGRAYGTPPAELLGITDPWEAVIVNYRAYMQGKHEEAAHMRDLRRDKAMLFPTFPANRAGTS